MAREDMRAEPTEQPSLAFCRALLAGPTGEEAVTFSAYLLPRRVAVWWGHQCLSAVRDRLSDQDATMLALVEDWVRDPEEEPRAAALEAAMASRVKTPGVWIALGAGWSGGSMAPRGHAPVPPQPYMTPRAVNAGILSALARVPLADRRRYLTSFVEMGISLSSA